MNFALRSICAVMIMSLAACGGGGSDPVAPDADAGDRQAAASPPGIEADEKGYLRIPNLSVDDFVKRSDTYELIDAFDDQRRGTLDLSNGWAVEKSEQYSSVVSEFSLKPFSTPYENCQGSERILEQMMNGRPYKMWDVLCRAERTHTMPAQGYSGGKYDFQMKAGDVYWRSQTEGGLPTIYYLRRPGTGPAPRVTQNEQSVPTPETTTTPAAMAHEPASDAAPVVGEAVAPAVHAKSADAPLTLPTDEALPEVAPEVDPNHVPVVVAPRLEGPGVRVTQPEYPPSSRRKGEQGRVTLKLLVAETGRISTAEVLESSGYPALDEAAINGVKRDWRVIPGTTDGVPTAMSHTVTIGFAMN